MDTSQVSYGFRRSVFLGLARPALALWNADNSAGFGLCIYFPELDCMGVVQRAILSGRSVPFGLSPRAVAKIRSGGFNLTKDLPMDRDLEQKPASTREAVDVDMKFTDTDESLFGDLDMPSANFD